MSNSRPCSSQNPRESEPSLKREFNRGSISTSNGMIYRISNDSEDLHSL
jgi:hypothetical protein